METAQNIVAQLIGVLLLLWVVGYTTLRAHEAWNRDAESPDKDDSASEGSENAGKGSFAYAQQRRKNGKADAPLWGLVAAANGLRKVAAGAGRAKGEAESDDTPDEWERADASRRWQRWRPEDEQPEGRERPYRRADEEEPSRWWRRRSGQDDGQGWTSWRRPDDDIEVEVVPRYGPRDPELDRPIRALDAAQDPIPEPAQGPSPGPDPEPESVIAEVIRMDTRERTPQVAGNGTLAIPGQQAVASAGGEAGTHESAMALASAIVTAIGYCPDPVSRTVAIIERSAQAVALKIDALQAAGVTGSVLAHWCEVSVQFQVALRTAKMLQGQIDAASAMAAAARNHQAAVGDPVQTAVLAAGSNAANKTAYYGPQ